MHFIRLVIHFIFSLLENRILSLFCHDAICMHFVRGCFTQVVLLHQASLSAEEKREVESIAGMGFPAPRVARAVKRFNSDRTKVSHSFLEFIHVDTVLCAAVFTGFKGFFIIPITMHIIKSKNLGGNSG